MGEQKIKQDRIQIGENIRRLRLERGLGQTEMARKLQLAGVEMTRETLVKIERGHSISRPVSCVESGICWVRPMICY